MNKYERLNIIYLIIFSSGFILLTFLPGNWNIFYRILVVCGIGAINAVILIKMDDYDVRTHIKNDPHSKEYSDWKFYVFIFEIALGIVGIVLFK